MSIDPKRLNEIFSKMADVRILVIGDVMLDRFIWGDCERISPEAPVPIVHVRGETERAGGAANVALNISKLGAEALVLGIIGKDSYGDRLKTILSNDNISGSYLLESKQRATTVKTRIIAQNQQVVRVDREDSSDIPADSQEDLISAFTSIIKDVDGIIISDYGKGVITEDFLKIIQSEAAAKEIFLSVDPKDRHFSLYRNISLITPNTKETSFAVGYKVDSDESVLTAGRTLKERLCAKAVLITRGAKGMSLFAEQDYYLPTMAQKVYDVTGAGDTVIATATAAYCAGADFREAAIIANHAAGVSVSELGTKAVTRDEIVQSMEHEKNS